MGRPGGLAGLRIGLLTASASRLGGGVFEAVVAQAAMIRSLGGEPRVFALQDAFAEADRECFGEVPVTHLPVRGPAQIGFATGLPDALLEADLDLLHLHGIWMYPSRAGTRWARTSGRPYLISPHGMLDPWITARGKAKKALARMGYERRSWRAASAFHALTAAEARDIARESGRDDSIVIANPGPPTTGEPRRLPPPHVVYLGRIHPKKNIAALLDAWAAVASTAARLTIAGWGDSEDVADLQGRLEACPPSVSFVGPVYGEDKQRLLASARFLALPSHSEGLPMVVLEAWAAGVPTIMSEACNLPHGFAANAALRCGTSAPAVASALGSALSLEEPGWLAMARAAQRLASTEFAMATIASRWAEAYRSLDRTRTQ